MSEALRGRRLFGGGWRGLHGPAGFGGSIRAAGLLVAMAIATALVAGQGWDEIQGLRDHPLEFAGTIVAAAAVLAVGGAAMVRWPILLPLLVVATLPFRIRLHVSGGQAVNLLVPLYATIERALLRPSLTPCEAETGFARCRDRSSVPSCAGDLPSTPSSRSTRPMSPSRRGTSAFPCPIRGALLPARNGALGPPPPAARVRRPARRGSDPGGDRDRPVRHRAHLSGTASWRRPTTSTSTSASTRSSGIPTSTGAT